MKSNFKYGLIIFFLLFIIISKINSQDVKNIMNHSGTVKLLIKEPALFVVVPDSLTDIRFLPDSIPDQFKIDGCRIIFSGIIGEVPANQRLPGTPLRITKINFEE
ncbi:MAG: hypothetical protein IPH11_06055 [Ignavibacteriales bacterium]|nr:hypothetical protein [Ignavibacteriales bacterium]